MVAKGASPTLLDSYEAERRPIAAHVLGLSNALLKQTLDGRNITTHRDASTIQLNVNYRGSNLARDDRDETPEFRAGDHAPDATKLTTVDSERWLFELTRGGRFTLLNFRAAPALEDSLLDLSKLHVVGHPTTSPGNIVDTAGHLANAYGAIESTLVLIRPDGYIGLISDAGDVSAATDYLAAIN